MSQSARLTTSFAEWNQYTGIYAGSKAAETAITDAFRLEMAPFGVKVFTVHTGAVGTNTLAMGKDFRLPETSHYKSIEKEIAARARGEDGTPRMKPSEYADRVVGDVLGGSTWQIWRGGYASIVRFTSSWFPASVSVSKLRNGLNCIQRLTSPSGFYVDSRDWTRRDEGFRIVIRKGAHVEMRFFSLKSLCIASCCEGSCTPSYRSYIFDYNSPKISFMELIQKNP